MDEPNTTLPTQIACGIIGTIALYIVMELPSSPKRAILPLVGSEHGPIRDLKVIIPYRSSSFIPKNLN